MTHRSPMHRRTRRALGAVAATSLAVAGAVALANTGQAAEMSNQDQPAVKDTSIRGAKSSTAIPGSYLVVLNDQAGDRAAVRTAVRDNVRGLASTYGVKARTTFDSALQGFSAKMTEAQARKLAQDERVAYVQQNQQIRMTQDNPTWGLDRVDQRDLPLDKKYTAPGEAENVNVYVIDTGIYAEHSDFGGRASVGTDTVGDGQNGKDCQGHGSHVAGTIAGEKWGLAKKAKVFGVRVLDCSGSGSTETVVAGIEWVTENAAKPAVANMSLGGGADEALDAAVKKSVEAGVTYAVAAGNESEDSCTGSPSREPSALTVGATGENDAKADFSDFGKCLDVFAPGVDVESVSIDGPDASVKHSGTSMASPHVAGAAALFLGQKPDATPEEVGTALTTNATPDKVTEPGEGSPNLLLYVGELNSPGPNG